MKRFKINQNRLLQTSEKLTDITLEDAESFNNHDRNQYALLIDNDVDIESITVDVNAFDNIVLSYPDFRDGRIYSQARLLRDRLNFRGHIIARGDILPDQIKFLNRCGIDIIELNDDDQAQYEVSMRSFRYFYQPSSDNIMPIWQLRRQRSVAAA